MFCFLFPLFGSLLPDPLRVLRCSEGRRRSHSRCFFRRITLARKEEFAGRKNLPEMHFKTEGTGTAAYIRTDKTCGGGGMEDGDKRQFRPV